MVSIENTEYVSLGSNCTVAYNLHKHNLRNNAYPFDWSKSSITQLLYALTDNCKRYINTLEITNFSNSYPYINCINLESELFSQIGTYKCKNIYGFTLSHELIKKLDFITLKDKIESRIKRLYSLKDNKDINNIIFIRIETHLVKPNAYKKNIDILIEQLKKLSGTKKYKLKLILHIDNNNMFNILLNYIEENKIELYFYDEFTPDWKMEMINWDKIFML